MTASFGLVLALPFADPLAAQGDGFYGTLPSMGTARQELATAVLGGQLYAAGGFSNTGAPLSSVERSDLQSGWAPVASMPTTLHHFGLAATAGRLFAVGGYVSSFTGTAAVHAYDPVGNAWSPVRALPQPRGALVAVELGGLIYAVGGVHPTRGVVGDLTVYDPLGDTWTTLPPMPTPREHLGAAAFGGRLWVGGGRVGFGAELRTVEVFDPATNTWTTMPDLPVAHGGTGAAVLRGRLLVFGGEAPAGIVAEVDEWDPARGSWRRVRDLPVPVHGISPAALGDRIVIAGGATVPGFGAIAGVQTFAYLPDGVVQYGASTHCGRPVWLGVLAPPLAGQVGFGWLTSADLPAGAFGGSLVAAAPDPAGTPLLGAPLFIALGAGTTFAVALADPTGVASLPLAGVVPPGLVGLTFYVQGGWLPPGGCVPLMTSDALACTIR
jgi:hypothetical protein